MEYYTDNKSHSKHRKTKQDKSETKIRIHNCIDIFFGTV